MKSKQMKHKPRKASPKPAGKGTAARATQQERVRYAVRRARESHAVGDPSEKRIARWLRVQTEIMLLDRGIDVE